MGAVKGDDRSGVDALPVDGVDGLKLEFLSQDVHGAVGGAVADDDEFQVGVVEGEEAADALGDSGLFVEGGSEDGYVGGHLGAQEAAQIFAAGNSAVEAEFEDGAGEQQEVIAVDEEEIGQDDELESG